MTPVLRLAFNSYRYPLKHTLLSLRSRCFEIALALPLATLLAGCDLTGDLSITPTELKVLATDDNSLIGESKDEPYVGYVKFKATFGNAGSVVVSSNTDLTTIDTSAEAGDIFDLTGIVDPVNFSAIKISTKSELIGA